MPIKGLTDQRVLARLGRIKLGIKVVNADGREFPRATDYFVCPPEIQAKYGEKPRELPITFLVNDVERIFPQDLKSYKAFGLWCKGNGDRAQRWDDHGKLQERECPCSLLDDGSCKPVATLNATLTAIPGLGVYQMVTRSPRAIKQINSTLAQATGAFGGIRGVRFILKLIEEETSRWDEKANKMTRTTIHIPFLTIADSLDDVLLQRRALGATVDPLMLMPAPAEAEDDDDPETHETPTGHQDAPGAPALIQTAPPDKIVAPGVTAPPTDLFQAPAASQHNDPAPPAAAQGKVAGSGLLMDECFDLAQKLDVDASTYRGYLHAVHGTVDLPHEAAATEIERLRDAMKNPGTAGAAKAAMRAGARKIGGGR